MEKNYGKSVRGNPLVALFILLGVMLCVTPAFAEAPSVSGYDSFYATQATDGSVDILSVVGHEGDTIYINMAKGKRALASHLAFTLDGENAQTDANGDMVGLVSVNFNGTSFSADDKYAISVFADREETIPLYEGTVSTLFARFKDDGSVVPLALRTLAKGENRAFEVPSTLEHEGIVYELSSKDSVEVDGRTVYDYKAASKVADSVTAHVSYYNMEDEASDPIRVDEIELAKGDSQDVFVEDIIASDSGELYRTIQLANKLTVSYPGTTEYTVQCKRLSDDWGQMGSFYTATIKYVDEDGKSLGVVDTVIVNKKYTYTAPTNIYVDYKGTVGAYKIVSDPVLTLNPGDAEGTAVYELVYTKLSDDEERTWTIVLENGSVAPTDSQRVIGRITLRGVPGESVTFDATKDAKDYVDYEKLKPTASCAKTYEHTFGVADLDVEQVVYFVPTDYVEPEAYDVTVNYINIATGSVITTQTYTASPSMRSDLEISSPETFSAGGVEWVRLDGQEQPIRHGFYSPNRTYTVYYRDVNDDLHKTTVIRSVRVEYKDVEGNTYTRPTTVINNGTTFTDNGVVDGGTTQEGQTTQTANEGTTTTTASDATDTGLQTGANLRSIEGDDGTTLVDEDGTDLATTRIEDDETPLAGPGTNEAAASSKIATTPMVVAGGLGAMAVAGIVLFFIFKRRRRGTDEASDDGLSE
ncbi:MAG: hypothetical protein Q4A07_06660 [Coriobacteriales bacterium]|nr:hypothetical protein [Coriobacteriales bacterium]